MANEMIKETEQVIDQEIVMALSIDRVMGLLLIGVTMLIIFRAVLIARNASLLALPTPEGLNKRFGTHADPNG